MSERFTATTNVNASKNTRLPVADEFSNYRFGRDAMAHVSRYMLMCERLIAMAKSYGRPLRVLDVGCGDVYVARVLQASFVVTKRDVIERYVGLDIDDRSLARTETTKPKSFDIELVCDDVTTGALERHFGDKEFDVVICTEVIEHIQPRFVPELLRQFRRIAHYGFISTPNWTGGSGRLPDDHVKEWDVGQLIDEMDKVGMDAEVRIGTFCQLTNVEKVAKANEGVRNVYEFLKPRLDKHMLSLVMARFIGLDAQNVLHIVRLP